MNPGPQAHNRRWSFKRDPLFRGDEADRISTPTPSADPSLVRHILYLGGKGRPTPYLSVTESLDTARSFAGSRGAVYETACPQWADIDVKHRSRKELCELLVGRGKGDGQWPSALEVMQARRYVEEHTEHLADFRTIASEKSARVAQQIFRKR